MTETVTEAPLKVCPHCAVATRTEADMCPSCGKPYARGRRLRVPLPGWALALLVIALAFGAGYGGYRLFKDDGKGSSGKVVIDGITFAQARGVMLGTAEPVVLARVRGIPHVSKTVNGTTCFYYLLKDQPGNSWGFCFRHGRLSTTGTLRP
jgi:hypothetical protein